MKVKTNLLTAVLIISVVILFVYLLGKTIDTAKRGRLEERFTSLVQEVDARIEEFDTEDFEEHINQFVKYFEIIDKRKNVFSAVYNSNLDELSTRNETFAGQPFNPFAYNEITESLKSQNSNIHTVIFNLSRGGKEEDRPFKVYFRKVFVNSPSEYLIVIIGMAFTMDNAELTPQLERLIYTSYLTMLAAISILVYLVTRYLQRYRELILLLKGLVHE